MAISAIRRFLGLGIRVPQDIALISVNDVDIARYIVPSLRTVRIPVAQMGYSAVKSLVDLAKDSDMPVSNIVLPTELIVRESCGSNVTMEDTRLNTGSIEKQVE